MFVHLPRQLLEEAASWKHTANFPCRAGTAWEPASKPVHLLLMVPDSDSPRILLKEWPLVVETVRSPEESARLALSLTVRAALGKLT